MQWRNYFIFEMEIADHHKLLFQLYEYLWVKSPLLKGLRICVPDTVIIDEEPLDWYFTAKDGMLKKKHKSKLNP